MKDILLYADGSCSPNPGPGGYGVILKYGNYTKEYHASFPNTTNNRMEIMGIIHGLRELREPCNVTVITDSQYVVNTMTKGWKRKSNEDLWEKLDEAAARHNVKFEWIHGHSGYPENERCDELAKMR